MIKWYSDKVYLLDITSQTIFNILEKYTVFFSLDETTLTTTLAIKIQNKT